MRANYVVDRFTGFEWHLAPARRTNLCAPTADEIFEVSLIA